MDNWELAEKATFRGADFTGLGIEVDGWREAISDVYSTYSFGVAEEVLLGFGNNDGRERTVLPLCSLCTCPWREVHRVLRMGDSSWLYRSHLLRR
jgi:hypothetical protein